MQKIKYTLLSVYIIFFLGCTKESSIVVPPKNGASIEVNSPIWISGIKLDNSGYSENLPNPQENEQLKTLKAGYWLANANGKRSQLVYFFEVEIKKPFLQDKVWTKMTFSNPADENKDIVYTNYLTPISKTTKGTHATLANVSYGKKYNMKLEVFSNKERTKLISQINQVIFALVDNTRGCVELDNKYKVEKYGFLVDGKKILSIEDLTIACDNSEQKISAVDLSIRDYWTKNLDTYYRIPKDWFVEKRFENNTSSLYITKDKFDENEQFKVGFSLHYIKDCSMNKMANPTLLKPSKSSKNLITNLAYNMGKTIVKKPYKFKDNHLIGFGVSIKDNNFTSRHISLGDDYNDVCLRIIFEAPNKNWNDVVNIGNAIIESHWRK